MCISTKSDEWTTFAQLIENEHNVMDVVESIISTLDAENIRVQLNDIGITMKGKIDCLKLLLELYNFRNVYRYDDSNMERVAIVLYSHKSYLGHVYIWPSSNTCLQMVGIRTSIKNFFSRQHQGVANKLINGVLSYAKKYHYSQIEVIKPIGYMPKILLANNFTQDDKTGNYIGKVGIETNLSFECPKISTYYGSTPKPDKK